MSVADFHHSESAAAIRANRAERRMLTSKETPVDTIEETLYCDTCGRELAPTDVANLVPNPVCESCWEGGITPSPSPDAEAAIVELQAARDAFREFVEHWSAAGRLVRRVRPWLYERVDAYPGWDGLRDVGAGRDIESWMDEVDEAMEDAAAGRSEDDED